MIPASARSRTGPHAGGGLDWELADPHSIPDPQGNIGLCATCRHVRRITSDRGSTFIQCGLSFSDPSFPKYPRLPVVLCRGSEPTTKAER